MLAAMFSGKFPMEPHGDGAFFIDRDGTHFRFILNYLRNGKLTLPEGATFLKELADEAEFYQIQGILDKLKPKAPKNFEESVILTNEEHQSKLIGWLPHDTVIGINYSKHLEITSQLKIFTPNVIAKDPRLQF